MSFIFGDIFYDHNKRLNNNNLTLSRHPNFQNSDVFFQHVNATDFHFVNTSLSSRNNLVVICYSFINNRKALADILHLPSTLPDSELILYAYLKWGKDCVQYLIGEFVFAIWNTESKKIFMARSPVGESILFYSFKPGKIFQFSNTVKCLFDYGEIDKKLDCYGAADHLGFIWNEDRTFFYDIKRLPSGHYLIFDKEKQAIEIKKYWSAESFIQYPLRFPSFEDYYAEFQSVYRQAIQDRISTTVPVASQLSGGLDSSSVVCMAAHLMKETGQSITALCHVPTPGSIKQPLKNWNYDDTPYMEAVGAKYDNVHLHYVRDDKKTLFSYGEDLYAWLSHPPLNPTNMLWTIQCVDDALEKNIKIILTGGIGNATISWCGPRVVAPITFLSILRKIKNLPKTLVFEHWSGRRKKHPWGHFAAISNALIHQTNLLIRYQQHEKLNLNDRSLINRIDYAIPLDIAIKNIYGVEFCDPTFDQRIVEFCLRCPENVFRDQKQSRLLVRKGMGDLMPEMIRNRTDRGMQSADWYKKIERQKKEIEAKLHSWKGSSIEEVLNLNYLIKKLKAWNYQAVSTSQGLKYSYYEYQYGLKLLRAVETGLFLEFHGF